MPVLSCRRRVRTAQHKLHKRRRVRTAHHESNESREGRAGLTARASGLRAGKLLAAECPRLRALFFNAAVPYFSPLLRWGFVGWALPTIFLLPLTCEGVWTAEMGNQGSGEFNLFSAPITIDSRGAMGDYYRGGRIAQLGEHRPYKPGVTGSSPVPPTKFFSSKFQVQSSRFWLEAAN